MACPVVELFHTYKKLLEDVWKKPEFFYSFFAPLKHSFNPRSSVFSKPKLKEIEAVATALALIWPDYRAKTMLRGKALTHFKNIILIMDFFLPIVRPLACSSTPCVNDAFMSVLFSSFVST